MTCNSGQERASLYNEDIIIITGRLCRCCCCRRRRRHLVTMRIDGAELISYSSVMGTSSMYILLRKKNKKKTKREKEKREEETCTGDKTKRNYYVQCVQCGKYSKSSFCNFSC